MTVTADEATRRFIEATRTLREYEAQVKDKSYRLFPIGQEAARYLDTLRWEGHAENTLTAYEIVYDRLAKHYPHRQTLAEFCHPLGRDELRRFLNEYWGEASPNTRKARQAALSSLFRWATAENVTPWNPMAGMRSPRSRGEVRRAHEPVRLLQLIQAQDASRDRAALCLLWPMGLRRDELRRTQIKDIDLNRDVLIVHGKGGKEAVLPIAMKLVRDEILLHLAERDAKPSDYLLYPKTTPGRPMDLSSVDRWFKRCLANAGMRPFPMHEMRHSSGDALWRATGDIVLAQQLLRHSSVGTTQAYLHPSMEDLASGLRTLEAAITDP